MKLEQILRVIRDEQPTMLAVAAHTYVQMSEFDVSKSTEFHEGDFDSVQVLYPAGAAVPNSSVNKITNVLRYLVVSFMFVLTTK